MSRETCRAVRVADAIRFGFHDVAEATMLELMHQIRWQDLLDIGIITFLVYRALQIVRGSRAMQMIIGLAVILVAYVSSRALGLFTLELDPR